MSYDLQGKTIVVTGAGQGMETFNQFSKQILNKIQ